METVPKGSRKTLLLERLRAFDLEEAPAAGGGWMAGVDEAGRGPLAGPVVAAAVILIHPENLAGINDSKKLSAERREELYVRIARSSIVGIGFADENYGLREYDGVEVPKGTFIPVISAQEISTLYCDEGTKVKFISTSDLYLYDTDIIPQNSEFSGYIEKIKYIINRIERDCV